MVFKKDILKKYNMLTLEEYKQREGDDIETEKMFYQTFLFQTDHIPNKIIEAQILDEVADDYTEILHLRKLARQNINKLETP